MKKIKNLYQDLLLHQEKLNRHRKKNKFLKKLKNQYQDQLLLRENLKMLRKKNPDQNLFQNLPQEKNPIKISLFQGPTLDKIKRNKYKRRRNPYQDHNLNQGQDLDLNKNRRKIKYKTSLYGVQAAKNLMRITETMIITTIIEITIIREIIVVDLINILTETTLTTKKEVKGPLIVIEEDTEVEETITIIIEILTIIEAVIKAEEAMEILEEGVAIILGINPITIIEMNKATKTTNQMVRY